MGKTILEPMFLPLGFTQSDRSILKHGFSYFTVPPIDQVHGE